MNEPNTPIQKNLRDVEIVFNGLLTADETKKLWEAVRRGGAIDEAEAEKLVDWAVNIRSGLGCLNLALEGMFNVAGWDESGEPIFGVPDEFLDDDKFSELLPAEETKC